jgi:hypothetical protein
MVPLYGFPSNKPFWNLHSPFFFKHYFNFYFIYLISIIILDFQSVQNRMDMLFLQLFHFHKYNDKRSKHCLLCNHHYHNSNQMNNQLIVVLIDKWTVLLYFFLIAPSIDPTAENAQQLLESINFYLNFYLINLLILEITYPHTPWSLFSLIESLNQLKLVIFAWFILFLSPANTLVYTISFYR